MQMMNHRNSKTDCPPTKTLANYLDGELQEPELGRCEQHLQGCERCEETIRGLRVDETANGSFAKLALAALQDQADGRSSGSAEDEPLVERLVDEIARLPESSIGPRLLEDRAAEVTQRLPPPEEPDTLGRLGGYEIKRLLGAGSTGVVYEAVDRRLHRRVALKVLRPSLGAAAKDRFMVEARSAAAIDHPGVVTIYQVGEDSTLAYMAMELSDGQTLEQRLHEVSFLPEPEIKRISKQIAQGLAAAHRHGLIHRDIKPANIWLKANTGQALILDFGLARIADDDPQMTATGMLAGTPNYMSPEQTRGLELDGRSDLFSLGCLMYRAVTGKLPFGSTGVLATLQAIQHDDARTPRLLNPHVSEDFSDLIMMLLQKHPTDRPEHANALITALQAERHHWPFRADRLAEIDPLTKEPVNDDTFSSRRTSSGFTRWIAVALAAGLLGLGWFAFGHQIIRIVTNQGELVIDAKDEAVKIEVLQRGNVVRVIDTKTDHSIDIEAGEYRLRLMDANPNVVITANQLTLKRGEREIVSVMQRPKSPANVSSPANFAPVPIRNANPLQVQNNLPSGSPASSFQTSSTISSSPNRFADFGESPERGPASSFSPYEPQVALSSLRPIDPVVRPTPPSLEDSTNKSFGNSQFATPGSSNGKDRNIRFDVKVDQSAIALLRQGRKVFSPVEIRDPSTNAVLDPSVVSDIALFLDANAGSRDLKGVKLEPEPLEPNSTTLRFEIPEQQLDRIEQDAFLFNVPAALRGKFDRVEFRVGPAVRRDGQLARVTRSLTQNGDGSRESLPARRESDSPASTSGSEPSRSSELSTQTQVSQLQNKVGDWRISAVKKQLKKVGIALFNYESAHAKFPAIGSRDSAGKLLLSWRVHLLPFLDQSELYKKFRLNEPWNSPHNLEMLTLCPKVFCDPYAEEKEPRWKTRFQSPVGKGFFLDPDLREQGRLENITFAQITDGTSNTVAVIRLAKSAAVPWTQPADWDGDAKKLIDDGELEDKQVWFARADLSVDKLPTPIPANFLKAILTRGGGEVIDWDNESAQQTKSVAKNTAVAGDTTTAKNTFLAENYGSEPVENSSRLLQGLLGEAEFSKPNVSRFSTEQNQ